MLDTMLILPILLYRMASIQPSPRTASILPPSRAVSNQPPPEPVPIQPLPRTALLQQPPPRTAELAALLSQYLRSGSSSEQVFAALSPASPAQHTLPSSLPTLPAKLTLLLHSLETLPTQYTLQPQQTWSQTLPT